MMTGIKANGYRRLCAGALLLTLALTLFARAEEASEVSQPVMFASVQGARLTLRWEMPAGATGCFLLLADYPSGDNRQKIDVGSQTEMTIDLAPGTSYFYTLQAYGEEGDGLLEMDNVQHVDIPAEGVAAPELIDLMITRLVLVDETEEEVHTAMLGHEAIFEVDLLSPSEASDVSLTIFGVPDDGEAFILGNGVIPNVQEGEQTYRIRVTLPENAALAADTVKLQAMLDPLDLMGEHGAAFREVEFASNYSISLSADAIGKYNLVCDALELDTNLVVLNDESAKADGASADTTNPVEVKNPHVRGTITVVSKGADVTDIPLRLYLEMPDHSLTPLQIWDNASTRFVDEIMIAKLENGIPLEVPVELVIDDELRGLLEYYFPMSQHLFAIVAKLDPDDMYEEYNDPYHLVEPGQDPLLADDGTQVAEVVVLPPQDLRNYSFHFKGEYEKSFSGKYVGGGFGVGGSADMDSEGLHAEGEGDFYCKIFGHKFSFANASGEAGVESNRVFFEAAVEALGKELWDCEFEKKLSWEKKVSFNKDKKYSKTFFLGPVPVKAAVGARGTVAFRLSADLYPTTKGGRAETMFKPWIQATAFAQAGVGGDVKVVGASAGVRCNLNLVKLSLRADADGKVEFEDGRLNGEIHQKTTLSVNAMSGNVELYAEWQALFGLYEDDASKNLASWDGYSRSTTLLDKRGRTGSDHIILTVPAIEYAAFDVTNGYANHRYLNFGNTYFADCVYYENDGRYNLYKFEGPTKKTLVKKSTEWLLKSRKRDLLEFDDSVVLWEPLNSKGKGKYWHYRVNTSSSGRLFDKNLREDYWDFKTPVRFFPMGNKLLVVKGGSSSIALRRFTLYNIHSDRSKPLGSAINSGYIYCTDTMKFLHVRDDYFLMFEFNDRRKEASYTLLKLDTTNTGVISSTPPVSTGKIRYAKSNYPIAVLPNGYLLLQNAENWKIKYHRMKF